MIDDKKPQTLHTMPLKSLSSPTSTLNTGSVGGTGADPKPWKTGTSFFMCLGLCMTIVKRFQ